MNEPRVDAWREVFGHLDVVMAQSSDDLGNYLERLERSNPAVHAQVCAQLKSQEMAECAGFLEPSGGEGGGTPLQSGARLGPYRIERELGIGGTGTVWLAQRDDGLYEGKVAIKVIHRHLTSSAVRDRFRREASLLSRLQHPNIARILDAGMHDGTAYLVLEHIQGEAIDTWCDSQRLTVPQRLRLFLDACEAVAHAHANLIVHRDIKPSNILVASDGRVKLLDFGLGKLIDGNNEEAGRGLTQVTGRVLTPEYAAPEQILNESVTTATDVYSLGVLLYLLLSGTRPFAAAGPSVARIEQAILESEPPALDQAARLAGQESATYRSSSVAQLRRALKGDLANITATAMQKRAPERYRSVLALADDVRRHLAHQPVSARKASSLYRLGRFIRRHRLGTAASLVATLVIAIAVSSAVMQARVAEAEAGRATAVKKFMLDIFNANSIQHPEGARARQTTAEELLAIASTQMSRLTGDDPALQAELLGVLGSLNSTLEKFDQAEALYRQRLEILEKSFGADDRRLVPTYLDLAELMISMQRGDEAPALAARAGAVMDANGETLSLERGRVEHVLGYVEYLAANNDAALRHFIAEVAILEQLPPSNELVLALYGLGKTQLSAGNADEALRSHERGLTLATDILGPLSDSATTGHQGMANVLIHMRRLPEAEEHLNKTLEGVARTYGPDSGSMSLVLLELARLQMQRGQYRAAAATGDRIVAIRQRLHGDGDPWALATRTLQGQALFESGDFERADEVIDATISALGNDGDPRTLVMNYRNRASLRLEQRRPADALTDARTALDLIAGLSVTATASTVILHAIRADAFAALHATEDAQGELQAAAAALGPDRSPRLYPVSVSLRIAQAGVALEQEQHAEAENIATLVLEELRQREDRDTLWTLEDAALRRLAEAQRAQGKLVSSCASLDAAIAVRETNASTDDPRLLSSRKFRAQCPRQI